MREIVASKITEAVKNLCVNANIDLNKDVLSALNESLKTETSPIGREILRNIIKNAEIARREKLPLCQDTGLACVFVEIGQDVRIIDGTLAEALNEGVSRGYKAGYLRKSVTGDPIARKNTGDNTPAMVHTEIVPGEKIKIQLLAKGGGAENCSAIKMFMPSVSQEEISNFIVQTVETSGPNGCPPLIIGVGIGGSFDQAPLLAKKALLKPIGRRNSNSDTAAWEKELLKRINQTGIGPMGLGGKTTALAVHIEKKPCHISSLPVAVNINCHSHRYKEAII
ncbi:fumarate hydratase [Candidatus Saganbacteria bacterium]|nr:fumarate hydratase [Candidatus Saganbacteria bacterium]